MAKIKRRTILKLIYFFTFTAVLLAGIKAYMFFGSQPEGEEILHGETINGGKFVISEENSVPQAAGDTMIATMQTSKGTIKIELDRAKAPVSVDNFVSYAKAGFYDGTVFHRVIPGFMVQGGGFTADGSEKETNAPIKNEAKNGLNNIRGTIAMARTNVVDSATSQFFINVADNSFLNYQSDSNYGYAVFGKVISGMDVVDSIVSARTSSRGPYDDWPVEDIVIQKVTIG